MSCLLRRFMRCDVFEKTGRVGVVDIWIGEVLAGM